MITSERLQLLLPELVLIPAGEFLMGSQRWREDERPAHPVRLSAFRAALAPVSNAQYALYLEATGAEEPRFWQDERFNPVEQPLVGVSWFEATDFCAWLANETSIPFRLPTEAEREYASLGGLAGADWPWAAEHPLAGEIGRLERPHMPQPECGNGYGLRCTAENVHEWCQDWYHPDYYSHSLAEAPAGPESGSRRVSRGGSWRHSIKFTRLTARASLDPAFRYNDFGFRVYADA
ncbi:MAG TPA: SUMF1/EgtB/PvdO family nonheme iron enzyme [Dehalococcoidia bacterium]|nr:SUMF1/EgtB/PvdO family nonheme iron enzyme [Dehalococcoidia bacterium]